MVLLAAVQAVAQALGEVETETIEMVVVHCLDMVVVAVVAITVLKADCLEALD